MKIVSIFAAMLVRLLVAGPAAEEAVNMPVVEVPAETVVETTAAPTASPEVEELLVSELELGGEWYGCWEIFSASGAWAEMVSSRWDCWAEMDEDDVLYIWDEDVDKETGLACIELVREGNELIVSGGWFMDSDSGFEQWRAMVEEDEEGLLLSLRGNYLSEVYGDFSFVMNLRPQK